MRPYGIGRPARGRTSSDVPHEAVRHEAARPPLRPAGPRVRARTTPPVTSQATCFLARNPDFACRRNDATTPTSTPPAAQADSTHQAVAVPWPPKYA